jgi:hypothetical protein
MRAQHRNADQVRAAGRAKSKLVGRRLVEVVVIPEEVGGFGSADQTTS